ncbi:LacI family DNA-binding transcriptional regulator [Streptomyces sp. NPDC102359]|uniref:LacI family DNA-binding transcriptional regulator n=1 Tax=unclassified Streptomyces TaxID=2593676 RepID=UPI0037F33473
MRITGPARRAGVSPGTVSHALGGKRPVSDATRCRVEAVVRAPGVRSAPMSGRPRSRRRPASRSPR